MAGQSGLRTDTSGRRVLSIASAGMSFYWVTNVRGMAMTDKPPHDGGSVVAQSSPSAPRTISSRDLLRGEKLLIINHDEEVYRLQLTAAGKLILTK